MKKNTNTMVKKRKKRIKNRFIVGKAGGAEGDGVREEFKGLSKDTNDL